MVNVRKVNQEANDLIGKDAEERELAVELIRGVYDDQKTEIENRVTEYTDLGFSDREAEVLALSEAGFTSKATGVMLGISNSTVDEYKRRASDKYERAGRMVRQIERRKPLDRTLKCKYCGHGTMPSKSEAKIENGKLVFSCRNWDCREENERVIW